MKLLIIIPHLGKGGAEDIIVNLSSHLSLNNENKIKILLLQRLDEDLFNINRVNENVEIVSLFSKSTPSTSLISKFKRLILYIFAPVISAFIFLKYKLFCYDFVHINLTGARIMAPWICLFNSLCFWKKKQTFFIETFHSNWHLLTTFQKIICVLSWSSVDKVICEIGDKEIDIVKKYSLAKNVEFIPFGVPKAQAKDSKYLNQYLSEKDINTDVFTILTISRLNNDIKRFDVILESLARLKKKGYCDFQYLICGDGPDLNYIIELISKLKLGNNVKLLGFVDNPQQVVYLADLFIIAMVQNFTGIAGLQAGMAGSPVIGVQTVDNYDSRNDVIWSSVNPDEISCEILKLIDAKTRFNYSKRVKDHVYLNYDIDKFYQNYTTLFTKI